MTNGNAGAKVAGVDWCQFAAELLVAVADIAAIEEDGALSFCLDSSQVATLPRYLGADFVVAESPTLAHLDHAIPTVGGFTVTMVLDAAFG